MDESDAVDDVDTVGDGVLERVGVAVSERVDDSDIDAEVLGVRVEDCERGVCELERDELGTAVGVPRTLVDEVADAGIDGVLEDDVPAVAVDDGAT